MEEPIESAGNRWMVMSCFAEVDSTCRDGSGLKFEHM